MANPLLAVTLRIARLAAALLVVAAIILATRLAQGPLDLAPFKSRVERALASTFEGAEVTLDQLSFDASTGEAALIAFGVTATSEKGDVLARVGRIEVDLDVPALLRGEIRPSALEAVGVRLVATRDDDGVLSLLAVGEPGAAPEDGADVAEMMRDWLAGAREFAGMPDLRVRHASLLVLDGRSGELLWRGQADAGATLATDRALVWAEIGYDEAAAAPLSLSATLARHEGGDVAVAFDDADLTALAKIARLFGADLPPVEGAIAGAARLVVDKELAPVRADVRLTASGLAAALPAGRRIAVDRLAGEGQYEAESGKISISGIRLGGDPGGEGAGLVGAAVLRPTSGRAYRLSGRVDHADAAYVAGLAGLADAAAGIDLAITGDFDLDFADGALTLAETRISAAGRIERDDLFYGPLALDRAQAFLAYRPNQRQLSLKGLNFVLAGVAASGEATATFSPDMSLATLDAAARTDRFPSETLAGIWPRTFSPGGHAWVARNLSKGEITGVDVAANKPADGPLDVRADFAAEGLEVRYWDPMPVATDVAGVGRLVGDRLEIDVTSAQTAGLRSRDIKLAMTDLGAPTEQMEVDGVASGAAARLLAVLDRPPLRYARWLGVDPESVDGAFTGRLKLKFPLIDAITVDDLDIAATGQATDARLPNAVKDWALEGAKVAIDVNTERLRLEGAGRMLDEPLDFAGDIRFGSGDERMRIKGSWRLTRDVRRALGLGAPAIRRRLTGVAPTAFDVTVLRGPVYEIGFDADLSEATLLAQEIGWLKPKGALARIEGTAIIQGATPLRVENIVLSANDLGVEADIALDPTTSEVARLSIARFRGAGHDFAADATFADDHDALRIYGRTADLRPLLEFSGEAAADPAGTEAAATPDRPLQLRVDLQSARLTENLTLQGLQGDYFETGAWPPKAILVAGYSGGEMRLRPASDAPDQLVLTASDFGALARGLGVTDIVAGGGMRLHIGKPDPEEYSLDLRAADFSLTREEVTRMSDAAAEGLLGFFRDDDRLPFDRLRAQGVFRDGLITVKKAQAGGDRLGVSAGGEIDLVRRVLDLRGAIAPAYGVSRAIGGIPILGQLLTGSKGEGVFAATYHAKGPLDDPDFEVNRLSALAPGILREVFETPPAGADAPPETTGPEFPGEDN